MSTHQITITGVPRDPTSSTPPPRREINDLVQDKMQFSLYIQALQAMMVENQNGLVSYFQIGGIHGLPYVAWDNAVGGRRAGYCAHGSVLFPTWHRPYVALFEQTLQAHAAAIAETYTTEDKALWQNAALNLRCPYWDSGRDSLPPREVIELEEVPIIIPSGEEVPVPNPLLSYTFHPMLNNPSPSARGRPKTIRNPSRDGVETNLDALIESLAGRDGQGRDKYRAATFKMLTRVDTWMGMSNHTSKHGMNFNRDAANSLEAIHDAVHGDVGGWGQFGDPAVAAFDPIFWLHHCNVDRLLVLWQALHPDEWVTSSDSVGGTFTINANVSVTAQTYLTPFWDGPRSFYTSNETRDWTAFNYTYPELEGLNLSDPTEVYNSVIDTVLRLYGDEDELAAAGLSFALAAPQAQPSAMLAAPAPQEVQAVLATATDTPADPSAVPAEAAGEPVQAASDPVPPATGTMAVDTPADIAVSAPAQRLDWTVRVRCKQYALGLSYTVLVFLGETPKEESKWRASPSFVGEHVVFANSAAEQCSNCVEHADLITEGYVDLTKALRRAQLPSLDPETVVPYLKDDLHWRIQMTDATVVAAAELESLEVAVLSVKLEYSKQFKCFKMASWPEHHDELTDGRPGGASQRAPQPA